MFSKAFGEFKEFFQVNPPEAALFGAVTTATGAFFAGAIDKYSFAAALFTAFMTFMVTESSKDKAQIANP